MSTVLTWQDGTRIVVPTLSRADADLAATGAVPRRLRAAVLLCRNDHPLGIVTRTDPPALIRRGDHIPAFVLIGDRFQGVMTDGNGPVAIIGGDLPDVPVVCCPECDYAEYLVKAADVAALPANTRSALRCHPVGNG